MSKDKGFIEFWITKIRLWTQKITQWPTRQVKKYEWGDLGVIWYKRGERLGGEL